MTNPIHTHLIFQPLEKILNTYSGLEADVVNHTFSQEDWSKLPKENEETVLNVGMGQDSVKTFYRNQLGQKLAEPFVYMTDSFLGELVENKNKGDSLEQEAALFREMNKLAFVKDYVAANNNLPDEDEVNLVAEIATYFFVKEKRLEINDSEEAGVTRKYFSEKIFKELPRLSKVENLYEMVEKQLHSDVFFYKTLRERFIEVGYE